jgi:hypothetical protein
VIGPGCAPFGTTTLRDVLVEAPKIVLESVGAQVLAGRERSGDGPGASPPDPSCSG